MILQKASHHDILLPQPVHTSILHIMIVFKLHWHHDIQVFKLLHIMILHILLHILNSLTSIMIKMGFIFCIMIFQLTYLHIFKLGHYSAYYFAYYAAYFIAYFRVSGGRGRELRLG